jgi:hypothetical protein
MKGGVYSLGNDADRLQILRVVHFIAGVSHPARRMDAHPVGKVDHLHLSGLLMGCGAAQAGGSGDVSRNLILVKTLCLN